jgi:hypothetical protein
MKISLVWNVTFIALLFATQATGRTQRRVVMLPEILKLVVSDDVKKQCGLKIDSVPLKIPAIEAKVVKISIQGHSVLVKSPSDQLKYTHPYKTSQNFARLQISGDALDPQFNLLIDYFSGSVVGLSSRVFAGVTASGASIYQHAICGASPYQELPVPLGKLDPTQCVDCGDQKAPEP